MNLTLLSFIFARWHRFHLALIALVVCLTALVPHAEAQQYSWSTFAGAAGVAGSADSPGVFNQPYHLARDSSGNVFVSDYASGTISKVTPGGVVSTFAGTAGQFGTTDATGAAARFVGPSGIVVDASGNVFVSDYNSHTIRMITPAAVVSTLAGSPGVQGSADGVGAAAQFRRPQGLALDGLGNLYVADRGNHTIRKIDISTATVSTPAGQAGSLGSVDGTGAAARFNEPGSLVMDGSGNLVVSEGENHTLRRVTPAGVVTTLAGLAGTIGSTDGTGSAARLNFPYDLVLDGTSNTILFTELLNHTVRRVTAAGVVSTVCGLASVSGYADGAGANARFNQPAGIVLDGTSNTLLVSEVNNKTIRRVSLDGVCTTWVGTPGVAGATTPTGLLDGPAGIARDSSGNLYVSNFNNHVIYKVTPGGVMSLFAGSVGASGTTDDPAGTNARFFRPWGMVCDTAGNVYVADSGNHTIRKITPAGAVTTLAGLAGNTGTADNTGNAARFNAPIDVKVDANGNVFVVDRDNNTIRKVTPAGVVTTLAGLGGSSGSTDGTGNAARFNRPAGVALDALGNVFVADQSNHTIRKVTPAGVVTTLAGQAGSSGSTDGTGSAARFNFPFGLVSDSAGNLIVSDRTNNTLRKVTPAGVVTTFCGSPGLAGDADGVGSAARFNSPLHLTLDPQGNAFLVCFNSHAVRKITPGGAVSTFIGTPGVAGSTTVPVSIKPGTATFNLSNGTGTAVDSAGNVFVADSINHTIRKITPQGVVSTFAGLAGNPGTTNGTGSAARFIFPVAIAVDGSNNLYVASNNAIRKITPGRVVSTLAGSSTSGYVDAAGTAALFSSPTGIAAQADGTLYVADTGNHRIRKIVGNVVTTFAGSGAAAELDGTGTAAGFNAPTAICVDAGGFVFVGDAAGRTLRKITPAGVVTTLAGLADTFGTLDGTGAAARFDRIEGAAVDGFGNVFVADAGLSSIRKVTAAGVVTTIGSVSGNGAFMDGVGAAARFSSPAGIALDAAGNLYVAERGNHTIRKGTRYGTKARLIYPANGSALPSTVTVFGWEPGVGATNYALFIGSTPGGYDLYAGIEGTNLFRAVTLPADIKVYVTMYSFIGGTWQGDSYAFEPAPSQKAVLVSPVQGSTLGSATLNLKWGAGLGASQYACWIGSAYGGSDLGAGAYGTGTNTATFTVPTDGGPVYVTLWSYINSVWQRNDYWFHTAALNAQRPARLTFPAVNGSTLAGASTTFSWDTGVGASSYALWVGSAPDGYDLYSALLGGSTNQNVPLPVDGRKVYVTLHTLIAGAYQSNSYQFTCPTVASPAAQIATPASGTSLGSSSLALTWNAGMGATSYALWVGTTPGGYDLYSGLEGASLNKTVTGLPTDGRVIHVTLHSLINGVYQNNTAWYYAQNLGATQAARLTSHASGASLPTAATTFTWNLGTGVTPNSYALWIGSTPGGYDLYAALETGTTRAVTLPTDGRKLYVTVHSLISGAYRSNSYGFTAPQITPVKAVLTLPAFGSTFAGSTAALSWTTGTGGTSYHLFIGSTPGGYDLGSVAKGTATTHNLTGLPTDGRQIYVTLYSLINGAYQPNSYIFRAWQAP